MLILLATFGITLLVRKEISIYHAIKTGLLTVLVSLIATVPLDSIMWQRFLWPEGEVLIFNTVENKSSEYGISPWYWYFAKALPKGLLLSLLLVPLAFTRIPQILSGFNVSMLNIDVAPFFLPVISFIALYSILPHKEIRFIFVAFPMFNMLAAKTLVECHEAFVQVYLNPPSRDKGTMRLRKMAALCLYLGCVVILFISFIASMAFVQLSKMNYPGGDALATLSQHLKMAQTELDVSKRISIFIDVASAMTGVSLFGQQSLIRNCPSCVFNKEGYEDANHFDSNLGHDYILSETEDVAGYHVLDVAKGFPRFDLSERKIATKDAIFILKRNS
jgi:alpha-1,6-mannosyltransferase